MLNGFVKEFFLFDDVGVAFECVNNFVVLSLEQFVSLLCNFQSSKFVVFDFSSLCIVFQLVFFGELVVFPKVVVFVRFTAVECDVE